MVLYALNLEMIDCIHKYFGDFYNFISLVIRDESQKSKTCEGFSEALYDVRSRYVGNPDEGAN